MTKITTDAQALAYLDTPDPKMQELRAYLRARLASTSPAPDGCGCADMARIGELIRTQDNRVTEEPIFIVQQRVGKNRWEFVTACFTEQGCKDYIARDGHNLKEPRIYADGSYRNTEWRKIRKYLADLAAPQPVVEKENG